MIKKIEYENKVAIQNDEDVAIKIKIEDTREEVINENDNKNV